MKLQVRHAGGELTVGSQKEFLRLYRSRIIGPDDQVLRGERWTRVAELPWIRGMMEDRRTDNRRLLWITLALLVLGLAGVLWVQGHAGEVARRTGALPAGAVRAVPPR